MYSLSSLMRLYVHRISFFLVAASVAAGLRFFPFLFSSAAIAAAFIVVAADRCCYSFVWRIVAGVTRFLRRIRPRNPKVNEYAKRSGSVQFRRARSTSFSHPFCSSVGLANAFLLFAAGGMHAKHTVAAAAAVATCRRRQPW